jgi:hypothetical protein
VLVPAHRVELALQVEQAGQQSRALVLLPVLELRLASVKL